MNKIFLWLLTVEDNLAPFKYHTIHGRMCIWTLRTVFRHRYKDAIEIAKLKRLHASAVGDARRYYRKYMGTLIAYHCDVLGSNSSAVFPMKETNSCSDATNSFCDMSDEEFLAQDKELTNV